jgi:hypothetical protein
VMDKNSFQATYYWEGRSSSSSSSSSSGSHCRSKQTQKGSIKCDANGNEAKKMKVGKAFTSLLP